MARTPSTMVSLGSPAPDFSLLEPLTGQRRSLADYQGKPLLVMFTCNHCPYVLHIMDGFLQFAREYQAKGLEIVAICANDAELYPDDSPEKMAEFAQQLEFPFAYLYDDSQQVAIDYQAACTPDFFLFDAQHTLVYRGQFDAARPHNDIAADGEFLAKAVDDLLADRSISVEQLPSLGCNIKWKPGNAPDYF